MPDDVTVAISTGVLSNYATSTIIWGILGSAISMRFVPQLKFWQKLTAVASGTAAAVAGTPLIKYTFDIKDEQVLFGVSFFIGVFGLSLIASIFDTLKNTKWVGIIESRLGKTPSDGSGG